MGKIEIWRQEGVDPVLSEMSWERDMLTRGTEQHDKRNEGTTAAKTATGQSILRKFVKRAEEAIELMQAGVNRPRVERTAKGTLVVVPADTLAMVALRVIIDRTCTVPEPDVGSPYATVSRLIGQAVETELNYRHWLTSSNDEAKAYAKEKGIATPSSFAERKVADLGVTERSIRQWRETIKELTEYKWSDLSEFYCGDTLLQCVVSAIPEGFEVHTPWRTGKPVKCVRMIPSFLDEFHDRESRNAMIQPIRLPMLTVPQKWSSM
jgi:hypothetical protein